MGFLKNLFGQPAPPWPPPGPIAAWPPAGEVNIQADATIFDRDPERYVEVVGESQHQPALEHIAGGYRGDNARYPDHRAILLPEPTNPVDVNAVRVLLIPTQGGSASTVGYLSRDDAVAYRPAIERIAARGKVTICYASLKGGWEPGISWGVTLRIGPSWRLMAELDRDWGPDPAWPPQFTVFGDDGRPYSRTDCPNCHATLDPMPKAKKKCPACGQPMWVQSGPDQVRYILAEGEVADLEAKWEAVMGRRG